MRLHVIGLPHTRFDPTYSWCAYTSKVARFAPMMEAEGFEVITYGNGEAELPGKYVAVTDETFEPGFVPDFNPADPIFRGFNNRATAAVAELAEPSDILCVIAGTAHRGIAEALPHLTCVEFGVGYAGVFAQHKVFESSAWKHYVYGMNRWDGSEFDTVIPNYFTADDFHTGSKQGYAAFLGRVCRVKGVDVAVAACRKAGMPLKIGGRIYDDAEWVRELHGDIEYVGELDTVGRAELLAGADVTLCPSRYVEPFCGVHVESLFSGVPVITSDFGAFCETFVHGVHGLRCSSVEDFAKALAAWLPSTDLRAYAISRFSLEAVGPLYSQYFDRLG